MRQSLCQESWLMAIERRGDPRNAARDIAAMLQGAGHEAYFAGGCVRDGLLGLDAEDFDIATSATPDQVQDVFPRARGVGEFFGVMLIYRNGWPIQVATFRTEGPYSDHRRPDHVRIATLEEDSARRDFTINGMYWDPVGERLVDFHDGEGDLARKRIRAIGQPRDRLEEDHLRMLRAVRFASRFGFEIEDETAAAIRNHRSGLDGISRERIGEEIRRMMLDPNRGDAAVFLERLGLAETVLGESSKCGDDVKHLASIEGRLERSDYAIALAAWALDRDGANAMVSPAPSWQDQLKLSNADRDGLREILEIRTRLQSDWLKLGVAHRKRLASLDWFEPARHLLHVLAPGLAANITEDVEVLRRTGLAPPRLLGGAALLESGMPAGPHFSEVIEAVYDAQLEGRIESLEEALILAKEIWQNSSRSG